MHLCYYHSNWSSFKWQTFAGQIWHGIEDLTGCITGPYFSGEVWFRVLMGFLVFALITFRHIQKWSMLSYSTLRGVASGTVSYAWPCAIKGKVGRVWKVLILVFLCTWARSTLLLFVLTPIAFFFCLLCCYPHWLITLYYPNYHGIINKHIANTANN